MNLTQQNIDALEEEWRKAEEDGENYFRRRRYLLERCRVAEDVAGLRCPLCERGSFIVRNAQKICSAFDEWFEKLLRLFFKIIHPAVVASSTYAALDKIPRNLCPIFQNRVVS